MMNPEQVTEMQEIHAAMEMGHSVGQIAEAREMSVEGVTAALSPNTMVRYMRYLAAKSQGLSSTASL